jgi:hypothetical protein
MIRKVSADCRSPASRSPEGSRSDAHNEGLSLAFRDLRIFACGSGNVLAPHGATPSFGQRLRDYMRDTLGYFNLTVTGYLGGIMTAYEVHIMPNRQDPADRARKGVIIDGVIYPASTQKIRF